MTSNNTATQCPACRHSTDSLTAAPGAAVLFFPCGHAYHALCRTVGQGCDAVPTCARAFQLAHATQLAQQIRLTRTVSVVPAARCHNWFPLAERRHFYVGNKEYPFTNGGHDNAWGLGRLVRVLMRPLQAYQAVEADVSFYCDGDILRQLQDSTPLSELRGVHNQRITSLYQLMQSMPPAARSCFFSNLPANTKIADVNALRAPTETDEMLLSLLEILGFTVQTLQELGTVEEFAHAFAVNYPTFYAKLCKENMKTLVSLNLRESDYRALGATAQQIVTSKGFCADWIEPLNMPLNEWHNLGATVALLRDIPLTKVTALHLWRGHYGSDVACEHAFFKLFAEDMTALDAMTSPTIVDVAQPLVAPVTAAPPLPPERSANTKAECA